MSAKKRQTWQLAEARAWLKRERPSVYEGIRKQAAKSSDRHDRREDLVRSVIAELMPWLYPGKWDEIEDQSRKNFGEWKTRKFRKTARKIAKTIAKEAGRPFAHQS